MRKQQGFTLVEIAIVLVIIGLLLGGILRGQELIQGARVRNVIDQQNGVRAAYFAFQDRFRLIPGNLTAGQVALVGSGVLQATVGAGTGAINIADSPTAFQNLTATQFLSCSVCTLAGGGSTSANSPANVYAGVLQLTTDATLSDLAAGAAAPTAALPSARTNVKTGNFIPSNVMAEIDLKVDDGSPVTGNFRWSGWASGAAALGIATCINSAAAPFQWRNGQTAALAISGNCGGGTIIN